MVLGFEDVHSDYMDVDFFVVEFFASPFLEESRFKKGAMDVSTSNVMWLVRV